MTLDKVIIVKFEDSVIEDMPDSDTIKVMTAAEAAEFFVGMAFMHALAQQAAREAEGGHDEEVSNEDILGGAL